MEYLKWPKFLDTNEATPQNIISEFIKLVDVDVYAVCYCTSPFVLKEHFEECISAAISKKYDSSFTAERFQHLMWTDKNTLLNFDPDNIPRTQDFLVYYNEISDAYVFKKAFLPDLSVELVLRLILQKYLE